MATPALLLSFCAVAAAPPPAPPARPADSVVQVIASVRYPDPLQPWKRLRSVEVVGSGVVIGGNRVLTNAHLVEYAAEVHVRGGAGGEKVEAGVESVGADVDLAVLTVKDKTFFEGRPPLARAAKLPAMRDTVEVYGFPVGGAELSVTKGVVSRVGYNRYASGTYGLAVQVSASINPGNSGGPAVVGGKMVGVVFGRLEDAENIGYVTPNEEIDLFLKAAKGGRYEGKPGDATGTQYQRLRNEALRRRLKLDRRTTGVLAVAPPGEAANPFRPFDVLTRVGRHDIDNDGMVALPGGMRAPFLALLPRLARGNAVPVTVLREGKRLDLSLPVTTQDPRLIRGYRGELPSYFIHGPLAFSPAREEAVSLYLRSNPLLYSGSPLVARRFDRPRFPGEELVVVTSRMFDHKIAKEYEDPVGQVLAEVNGQKVKNLRHLVEILRDCTDEFLTFRFAEETSEVLVFGRKEMEKATEEVLEEAGIPPARRGSADVLAMWKKGAAKKRPDPPAKEK